MKPGKKWIECAAVATLAAALSITAMFTNDTTKGHTADDNQVTMEVADAGFEGSATAGIATVLSDYELEADARLQSPLTIKREVVDYVTASAEGTEEESLTEEELEWQNYLMADVEKALNVRVAADAESELVGKLRVGDVATIVEQGAEWTKISSGNVEGYVKNEYCVFGTDALAYAKEHFDTVATVLTNGLRVRTAPSVDSDAVKSLEEHNELVVDTEAEPVEGWVAVKYKSTTCYVSAEYVTVGLKTGKAITMEEEAAIIAAEKKAKAQAAAAANQTASSGTVQGSSLAASADDVTLLAALIQCETGGQSYECQLAVGAVVVNRVKSGNYPNTVYDVIYQGRQFGPASSGRLESRLASGVSDTAYAAAQAALAGADNTNGATAFKLASSGHAGTVIDVVVFY